MDVFRKSMLCAGLVASAHVASAGLIATGSSEGYLDTRELGNRFCYADEERTISIALDGAWYGAPAELYVNGKLALSVGATERGTYVLPVADGLGTFALELRSGGETATTLLTVLATRGVVVRIGSMSSEGQFLDSRPAGTKRVLTSWKAVLPTAYSSLWNLGATGAEVRVFDLLSGRELTERPLVSEGAGAEGTYPFSPDALGLDGLKFKLTHFDGQETLEAFVHVKGGAALILR